MDAGRHVSRGRYALSRSLGFFRSAAPPRLVAGARLDARRARVAGAAATYLAVFVWSGFDLIDALGQIGKSAVTFNVDAARPYSVRVRQNLLDFAFGAGVCQAVCV